MGGWLGDSVDEGTNKVRTMEQILEDEKTQKNILELHIQKLNCDEDDDIDDMIDMIWYDMIDDMN